MPLEHPSTTSRSSARDRLDVIDESWKEAPVSQSLADAFRRHSEVASDALRAAAACGRVVIVTLAREGWVELSCKNFLPGLNEVLRELGIEVFYARDMLSRWKVRCAMLDNLDLLQLMKQAAMRRCIKRLYSRPTRSWKNLISIGDSRTEHDALTEVAFACVQHDQAGLQKNCRCKTVKLLEEPDMLHLTAELEVLAGWIQPLAIYDGDIEVDLSNSEESLSTMEKLLQESCQDDPEDVVGDMAA